MIIYSFYCGVRQGGVPELISCFMRKAEALNELRTLSFWK